jgi:hypothetical protein
MKPTNKKKRMTLQCNKNIKYFVYLIFVGFSIVIFSFTGGKEVNPYSWLYNDKGLLVADTSISMDTNLFKCYTDEISGLSYYMQNKTMLINNINYPPFAYESGYSNDIILELTLEKIEFPNCQIKEVTWPDADTSYTIDSLIVEYYKKSLEGLKLYHTCDCKMFVIHIPIKLSMEIIDVNSNDFGINKGFENNWFFINLKTHGVVNL